MSSPFNLLILVGFSFLSDLCFWDTNTDFFVCEKKSQDCAELMLLGNVRDSSSKDWTRSQHQLQIPSSRNCDGTEPKSRLGLVPGSPFLGRIQSLSTTGLSSYKLRPLQGLSLSSSRDHLYRARAISKVRIDCLYTWVHTISAWMLNGLRYLKDIRVFFTSPCLYDLLSCLHILDFFHNIWHLHCV